MRYLRGERKPPESVALRLRVLEEDTLPELRELLAQRAASDRVPAPPARVPVAAHRYRRPPSVIGVREESEIVIVDVSGLTNEEVANVVRQYWTLLRKSGQEWNIRFLVNIAVQEYFGGQPDDPAVARSFKRRKSASIWIPPQHFAFVRGRRTSSIAGSIRSATEILEYLNEVLGTNYAGRLKDEFTFSKIAFIPVKPASDGKRYQKRKGKR